MCGVAGTLERATPERDELVARMMGAIHHRGPDETGTYQDDLASLGMTRLAIQDVSHGHQPVYSEDRDVVAMLNGELYNAPQLRAELTSRGHTLPSHSDTECLPHLYEEYGDDFVHHLDGMFVAVVWDRRRRRLVIARDRLGKKPLYWRTDNGVFQFGSELKCLLVDRRVPREVDHVAVHHYLTFQYVPAPWSAVRGVHKLPPASRLVWEDGQVSVERFWSLDYIAESDPDPRTDAELDEQFADLFEESVRKRLLSERPIGSFLSGGLDSSAVVVALKKIGVEHIHTFSIGFQEDTHNELPHAAVVAKHLGTDHMEMVVTPDAANLLPVLARQFDEPFADASAIPSWHLAHMTAEHVVVALNGDGGDELLGGYKRYERFLRAGVIRLPQGAHAAMGKAGFALLRSAPRNKNLARAGLAARIMGESSPARRYAGFLSYFRPEEKRAFYTQGMRDGCVDHDTYTLVEELWEQHPDADVINQMLMTDTFTYLPGDLLAKVDITTMSASLEARSPFLDSHLFEWAAGIHGPRKMPPSGGKAMLRRYLDGRVPHGIIHRSKQGFGVPLGDWLRTSLRELTMDTLAGPDARVRSYFTDEAMQRMISDHMSGVDRTSHLYATLMLELWHREVLEG